MGHNKANSPNPPFGIFQTPAQKQKKAVKFGASTLLALHGKDVLLQHQIDTKSISSIEIYTETISNCDELLAIYFFLLSEQKGKENENLQRALWQKLNIPPACIDIYHTIELEQIAKTNVASWRSILLSSCPLHLHLLPLHHCPLHLPLLRKKTRGLFIYFYHVALYTNIIFSNGLKRKKDVGVQDEVQDDKREVKRRKKNYKKREEKREEKKKEKKEEEREEKREERREEKKEENREEKREEGEEKREEKKVEKTEEKKEERSILIYHFLQCLISYCSLHVG